MVSLDVPGGYGWVLIVALSIALHCMVQGLDVFHLRAKLFPKEFFDAHFPELKEVPQGGYPDSGEGRFADRLSLDDWINFSNHQRVHANYMELLPVYLLSTLIGGLFYPKVCVITGVMLIISRKIYGSRYRTSGPNARHIGTLLDRICALILLGCAFIGAFNFAGGLTGLRDYQFRAVLVFLKFVAQFDRMVMSRRALYINDHYTAAAKRLGYPARSVFKLKEMDEKLRLLKPGHRVVDLGCVPGSWLLYAAKQVATPTAAPASSVPQVLGLDINAVAPDFHTPANTTILQRDVFEWQPTAPLRHSYDVLLSDMGHPTHGIKSLDSDRSLELCVRATQLAWELLKPNTGCCLLKVFAGRAFDSFHRSYFKLQYAETQILKPAASRAESVEIYLFGRSKRRATRVFVSLQPGVQSAQLFPATNDASDAAATAASTAAVSTAATAAAVTVTDDEPRITRPPPAPAPVAAASFAAKIEPKKRARK